MNSVVLDASAVLAVIHAERGQERVISHMSGAMISAVNYSEVLKKAIESGSDLARTKLHLDNFMLEIVPFDSVHASIAAEIWPAVKSRGLSLADRACLALGIAQKAMVLTADSRMAETDLAVKVKRIRDRR